MGGAGPRQPASISDLESTSWNFYPSGEFSSSQAQYYVEPLGTSPTDSYAFNVPQSTDDFSFQHMDNNMSYPTSRGLNQSGRRERSPRSDLALKRQRLSSLSVANTEEAPVSAQSQACGSVAESIYSECCSSCSGGLPCAEPDCDIQRVEVVPCNEVSCEQPVCTSPCLALELQKQNGQQNDFHHASQDRLALWQAATCNAQFPLAFTEMTTESQRNQLGHNSSSDGTAPYTPISESPTPSTIIHISTPRPIDNLNPKFSLPENKSPYPLSSLVPNGATRLQYNANWWPAHASDPTQNGQEPRFECPWDNCGAPFLNQQDWVYHLHQDHLDPQMVFSCPLQAESCQETIASNPLHHLEAFHGYNFDGINGISCPDPSCHTSAVFCNPAMLHDHFDEAHAIPVQGELFCQLNACDGAFQDQHEFKAHLNEWHQFLSSYIKEEGSDPSNPLKTTCSEEFAQKENKKEIESTTPCKWQSSLGVTCEVVCESQEALQKHIKSSHLNLLTKHTGYICQWEGCNRAEKRGAKLGFSQRGKLERHMASHTGFKSSICDICGEAFSAPQSMKQHRLLHTGERPWKCKYCDRTFPQQSACTVHERTHTKERPLVCEICGKTFPESSNLAKHRKTHLERGQHECTVLDCGRTFHRLDQLKRHQASHERSTTKSSRNSANTLDQKSKGNPVASVNP